MRLVATILICSFAWTEASPASADDTAPAVAPVAVDPWAAVPAAVDLVPDPTPPTPGAGAHHRRALSLGTVGGISATFVVWAYFAWYRDHPARQGFELGGDGLFEDHSYAGGSDKLGHAWATMTAARMSSQLLRYGGWKRSHAAVISAGLASMLFTLVEYADAYYYEFSVGDLGFDLLGAAAAAALEWSPRLDALFDFRVEWWPSDEYKAIVRGDRARSDIKKVNFAEDYSGQTYLLALHLGAFPALTERRWTSPLRYLDAVLGYQSNKYRPAPSEVDGVKSQTPFLGLSLNLQGVLDRVLAGGGPTRRGFRTFLHGASEIANVPFTSTPVGGVSRRLRTFTRDHHDSVP